MKSALRRPNSAAGALLLAAALSGCTDAPPPSQFRALKSRFTEPSVLQAGDRSLDLRAYLGIWRVPAGPPGSPLLPQAQVTLVVYNPLPEPVAVDPRRITLRDDEDHVYSPLGEQPAEIVVSPGAATRAAWTFNLDAAPPEGTPPEDVGSYRFSWNVRRGDKETRIDTKFLMERVVYVEAGW